MPEAKQRDNIVWRLPTGTGTIDLLFTKCGCWVRISDLLGQDGGRHGRRKPGWLQQVKPNLI